MELKSRENETATKNIDQDSKLTKSQRQKIIMILFGKLLKMHRNIMIVATLTHVLIIFFTCVHMFTLGTIESENKSCYLTWPLMHLFYAFINYLFAWFFCYNAAEITNKKGHNVLILSKRFIKVLIFFSITPIPLKFLSNKFCRNWTISWESVYLETGHILIENILIFIYFAWFERKYTGFKIFYKESIF